MTNANEKSVGAPADQTIWRWKSTARLTTNFMQVGFAVAAIVIAGTTIYAATKGVALSPLLPAFIINPWVIAAIASYVSVYFAAKCISAWQETYAVEKTQSTINKCVILNKRILDDVIEKGTLFLKEVEKEDGTKVVELSLQLSGNARKVLLGESKEKTLYLAGKKDGNIALKCEVEGNGITVQLYENDHIVSDRTKIRKALDVTEGTSSLELMLSKVSPKGLKDRVGSSITNAEIDKVVDQLEESQYNKQK